jgi:hypothetical protein
MTAKPIVTDVNPAAPEPAAAGIMHDLQGTADGGATLTDLGPLSAKPRRKVNIQTLVVGLVLVVSALAIYTMRKRGMDGGMRFKSIPMASEIDKVKGNTHGSEAEILRELARIGTQLPQDDQPLQKNPFLLDEPADTASAAPQRDTNAERQAMIRDKLGAIKLNSVLDGSHPVARINDRMVKVGDMVDDIFLVAQIHDRTVDFIVDGRTYTLSMGEGTSAPAKRSPQHAPPGTPPPNPRK